MATTAIVGPVEVRCLLVPAEPSWLAGPSAAVAELRRARPDLAVVAAGPTGATDGRHAVAVVDTDDLRLAPDDPRIVAVVAAVAGCPPRTVLVAAPEEHPLAAAARPAAGHLPVPPGDVDAGMVLADLARWEEEASEAVGVGPHPEPWPDDERLDPALLARGDRRNVVDRFRYWREDAIVAELDRTRLPVHVAVENWRHDLNIGTVVRNANAFNVAGVHVVGRRRWNRRGAMATDRYLSVHHHADVEALASWAGEHRIPLVGIDNVAGARPLEATALPSPAVLVLGQEGPGLTAAALEACEVVCAIAQHGSTRSLNAGVASGIALWAWAGQRAAWPGVEASP